MLSKKAARSFFLVGTFLSFGAFILLTIDTFQRIPEQTRRSELSESAIRGKVLWEENNCMGCHTLFGEGAYYAPELTKVYERRGPDFIRTMLRDPQAIYPGQRKMQQYDFTEDEIDDLVAFLKWCGKVDLNGFPKDPPLAQVQPSNAPAAIATDAALPNANDKVTGATDKVEPVAIPEVFESRCRVCHALGGAGGSVGPALDGVGNRLNKDYLFEWIKDPQKTKPGTTMPNLGLQDDQIQELAEFLAGQQ